MKTFDRYVVAGALAKYWVGQTWVADTTYADLVWMEGPYPKPTEAEFEDACERYEVWQAEQRRLYGYRQRRMEAYDLMGSSIQALAVAIIDTMDGSDPQKLIDLQVIRNQVKAAYPKPDEL